MIHNSPGDARKISAAIRASGKTQREIARAAGVSEVSISHYATGYRKPSPGNLVRLARALSVSVRDLLDDPAEARVYDAVFGQQECAHGLD
jgi:transcriptional regulator with XRE-family HTH domain